MMLKKHVARHLSAYCHDELTADERRYVEAHLQRCSKCRAALDETRAGIRLASTLSLVAAPESIWTGLHGGRQVQPPRRWILGVAAVTGVVLAATLFLLFTKSSRPTVPAWEVSGVPGVPRLRPGETLQTSSSSEALVRIANIGQLTMDPNTRIRLLVTHSSEHRIALDRGKVEATTWAPPRLFIVETPSAKAVDLGCRYTLEVEEDGSSLLHVTLGLVALERDNRETIVPAGAFCRTRAAGGPGTPFYEDSSAQFQSALQRLDGGIDGPERARQLQIVLTESRIRDVLSLWHLLFRMDAESRGLIYDRMARSLPPPPEVTRDGIMVLNQKMLDSWKEVVSQLWQ
jgi:hypothetical protein